MKGFGGIFVLAMVMLVLFSSCTSRYYVLYKKPEIMIVDPGDKVRVRTKDNKLKTFKILEVQNDKIVGKKVEFNYHEIYTMEKLKFGQRYFFIDSLEELKNKKVRVRTKDQKNVKFLLIHVEDSVLRGVTGSILSGSSNVEVKLSEIESIYVNESNRHQTRVLVGVVLGVPAILGIVLGIAVLTLCCA